MDQWPALALRDGTLVPSLAFGTGRFRTLANPADTIHHVSEALQLGYTHIDTAQHYTTEPYVGQALAQLPEGLPRPWITTKWGHMIQPAKSVPESIKDSLEALGVPIDLYLIHTPRVCNDDVPGVWRQFIDAKASNPHIRHIGVSNFRLDHLEELLEAGLPMPEVNQIEFHPGFYQGIRPLLAFHREHRILTAGYSPVGPLQGGKPAPAFLQEMADRHKATPAQILLAWAKGKGVTVVMSSSKEDRRREALEAGEIQLSESDVQRLDLWE